MKKYFYFLLLLTYCQVLQAQYEQPVFMNPGDNLQDTIDAYPTETLYILKEGVHRNQRIIPKHGDILIGEPGAIMNGSIILDSWVQEGQYWTHTIPAAYAATQYLNPYPCEDIYSNGVQIESEICRFPQSLFKDDLPLWRVISLDYLDNVQDSTHTGTPVEPFHGDWYFDTDELKVYLSFDPNSYTMESTIKVAAFNYAIFSGGFSQGGVTAEDVTIKGLTIEKYICNAATLGTGPEGWVVENNNVQLNDTGGIGISGNALVRSNKVNNNGQTAMGGNSTGLVENNEIAYNNYKRFKPTWHAVTKWNYSDGLTLRNNYVHDNYGPGLWCDGTNVNITYEGNTCENNGGPGIFHEISQDAIIRCNNLINNRSRAKPPIGTSDATQNLYISNGSNVLIEHNYIRNDSTGRPIVVVQNLRDTLGLFSGSPVEVQNNHIVYSVPPLVNVVSSFSDSVAMAMYGDSIPLHFFDNNHYHIADFDADKYYFGRLNDNGIGTGYKWGDYQAAGFEPNSTIDTNIISAPIHLECADIPKQMLIKAKLLLSCLIEEGQTEMTLPAPEDRVHFQPFATAPWNYQGKDICPKFYSDMVDWVLLEIRDASNPVNILQQKAAILLKDGSIVDAYSALRGVAAPGDQLDGVVIYDLIPNKNYLLSVQTRQQTMAMANTIVLLPNAMPYDFTSSSNVANISDFVPISSILIALNQEEGDCENLHTSTSLSPKVSEDFFLNIHPNPFQNQVSIELTLQKSQFINLDIYDASGRLIQQFEQNSLLATGSYHHTFIAKKLKAGMYFVRLQTDDKVHLRKLILIE